MKRGKQIKWELSEAIKRGKKSLLLLGTYGEEMAHRFKVGEREQHTANVDELEQREAGQAQTLSDQMSKTKNQEDTILQLHDLVIAIRKIVKGANASKEIKVAYGVGMRIMHTQSSATAAGKILIDAYNNFETWSNNAGIVESDIDMVDEKLEKLKAAEKAKGDSVFIRKSKTTDKNTLQRHVEDMVTRISAMGQLHFLSNPTVAKLFADLIS
jgi:hypothetical protein